MALPVINYAALPPSGDPEAKQGIDSLLQGLQKGMQLYNMPKNMQADLQAKQLANALSKNTLDYAPQMSQADLQGKQAQNYLTGQQGQYYGQNIESEIAARQAQADMIRAETGFLPLKYTIEASNTQRANNRFGNAYQLSKMLQNYDAPTRSLFISQHPQEYANMVNDLANQQAQQQDNSSSDMVNFQLSKALKLTPEEQAKLLNAGIAQQMPQPQQQQQQPNLWQQGMPQQGQGMPPQGMPQQQLQQMPMDNGNMSISPQLMQALAQQQQGGGVPGMGQPNAQQMVTPPGTQQLPVPPKMQQMFSTSPEQAAELQRASQMKANQDLTTAATRRQMEGGMQIESIMNDPGFQSRAVNAAAYAGALGKGKAYATALSQQNPKVYEDYLTFANGDMVLLRNRIKTLDAMGGTDKQREELEDMYKKAADSMTSNPEQFLTQINNLGMALDNVARSVQKSATPISPINRLEGYKPIGGQSTNTPTQEQLEYTAKKYGQTVDQVKKTLGLS